MYSKVILAQRYHTSLAERNLMFKRGSNVRKHMLLMFKIIRAETSIIALKNVVDKLVIIDSFDDALFFHHV